MRAVRRATLAARRPLAGSSSGSTRRRSGSTRSATSEYGGDEPHYLLTAKSLVDDRNVDLLDEYRERALRRVLSVRRSRRAGSSRAGCLNEPHGVGFPLLIAPAYAIGGAHGVELLLAAIAALAVALAYALALRVVPDPWALGAALAAGLSPPFLAHSTAVYPAMTAGAVLAGAALLALRIDRATRRAANAFGCFVLLGRAAVADVPVRACRAR